MSRLYKAFRITVLSLLGLFVLFFLFVEISIAGKAAWIQSLDSTSFYKRFQGMHNFIFFDPYTARTLKQKDNALYQLTGVISNRINVTRAYTSDKYFNEQLFSFYISQKIDDIKTLTDTFYGSLDDFKDLVIIDSQKNLIFKYGSENFSVQFYDTTNRYEIRYFEDRYALIYQNSDPAIQYEYQVIAVYDYSAFNDLLKELSMPAFVYLKDRLVRNRQFPLALFRIFKEKLGRVNKQRFGLKILEVIPVRSGNAVLGYAGVLYPVRSLGSYLLFILKIGIIALLGVALVLLDRWLLSLVSDRQIAKEEKKILHRIKQPEPDQNEEVTDHNLEWIDHFIEDSEKGKKNG